MATQIALNHTEEHCQPTRFSEPELTATPGMFVSLFQGASCLNLTCLFESTFPLGEISLCPEADSIKWHYVFVIVFTCPFWGFIVNNIIKEKEWWISYQVISFQY